MKPFESWESVGTRIAEARSAAGLTQEQLAYELGLDRTAVSKIETGRRELDSLELARISAALGRPLEWFVSEPPQAILSWRASQAEGPSLDRSKSEWLLEDLAAEIELLWSLDVLDRPGERKPIPITTVEEAIAAANSLREELGCGEGAVDLLSCAEKLGLYVYILDVEEAVDGGYLALEFGGLSVVNGKGDPGRRRFTLAHEIGHHMAQDEFTTDWAIGATTDDRERLINVFAAHLQLPTSAIVAAWQALNGKDRPRDSATVLAAEYRVSWSTVCARLRRESLVTAGTFGWLLSHPPTSADWTELGIAPVPERPAPVIPLTVGTAVIKAYKRFDLTAERAVDLLHGTVAEEDLPLPNPIPLEALTSEL